MNHPNLGDYLASLNPCGYCGRIISGEMCQDETGEMCDGEIQFAEDYYAQQQYEEEMAHELQARYDDERWRLYAIEQGE